MKILSTSDLHHKVWKWKSLSKACAKEKPEIVLVAGDLFCNDAGIQGQYRHLPTVKKYCEKIKDLGAEVILTLGNDDNTNLLDEMVEEDGKLWHFLHNSIKKVKGYEFVGMPYVCDHPFGYKQFVRAESEDDLGIEILLKPFTKRVMMGKDGFEDIDDFYKHLESLPTLEEELNTLKDQCNDLKKSIWLIHNPPTGCRLDVTSQYQAVGSEAVTNFIQEQQPLVTVHGHIHESPLYGKKWYTQIGDTLAIQAGQLYSDLFYCTFEIEDGRVFNLQHSIYGGADEL